jgi:hypothetical protein
MKTLMILIFGITLNINCLFGKEKEKKVDYLEKHRMSRFERIPTWRYKNDNDSYVIGSEWKEAMLRWEIRYPIWRRVWEDKEMDKETKRVYLNYVIWDKKNLG